jgi:hypothetical protein
LLILENGSGFQASFSYILNIKLLIHCVYILAQAFSGEKQSPTFLQEPPNRNEFLNTSGVEIPCTAYGNPSPVIRWQNEDGTPAVDIPGLRHVRLDGSLVFQPFRLDQYRQDVHATTYRCTATNAFGTLASRDVYVGAGRNLVLKF